MIAIMLIMNTPIHYQFIQSLRKTKGAKEDYTTRGEHVFWSKLCCLTFGRPVPSNDFPYRLGTVHPLLIKPLS